ncbi:MAG TPA: hypothetical protein PLV68_07500, partial [Ilumatobacteraceae bacterium]|nr:hypothetical protein [Ilumatobacteraceae bacterium]
MAALDVFLPDVLAHAPDAPDPYARLCLVRAAQEFCQRTFAWKAWLACVAGTAPNYTATALADSQVVRLEAATLNGTPTELGQWWTAERDPATYATTESA